jgi:hypothetical protein
MMAAFDYSRWLRRRHYFAASFRCHCASMPPLIISFAIAADTLSLLRHFAIDVFFTMLQAAAFAAG